MLTTNNSSMGKTAFGLLRKPYLVSIDREEAAVSDFKKLKQD